MGLSEGGGGGSKKLNEKKPEKFQMTGSYNNLNINSITSFLQRA